MQQFSLCFGKVKKDCLKFIKSQETKADKFKNKERMIKSFLIPLCFWISKKADKKSPYFVGLAGGQGTGKTTISSLIKIILTKYFKLKVFRISIDDFYKTRKERVSLSKKVHPMLLTRGVPGTHDINMMLSFFRKAKSKQFKKLKLPTFNKATDDRFNKKYWYDLKDKPDVIIFEGWCVGAKSEKNNTLKKTINSMEKTKDHNLIWRKYVNQQLKSKYKNLYSQLNCLIYLKAKNFSLLHFITDNMIDRLIFHADIQQFKNFMVVCLICNLKWRRTLWNYQILYDSWFFRFNVYLGIKLNHYFEDLRVILLNNFNEHMLFIIVSLC